ncbi:unnamed protein product [Dimorphilus gyrociliatus]|uniref:NtA domain-containing protein n=1 Tax=Dimorphilus gyrociliatus TaxID=2664684 RepID=A0A7I8VCB8_9ANNE|nr:unnamed protein product [Dimorphilus gyrociliatus]
MKVACIIFLLLALAIVTQSRRQRRHYWSKSRCLEKTLEEREEYADVVLAATVRRVRRIERHLVATVVIKGIFKGSHYLNNVHDRRKKIYKTGEGRYIRIKGLGNPKICDNMVYPRDTRIFLLKYEKNGDLFLNSSLVRITLNNMERTDAAVSSEYKLQ